jgi:hypothetical protein
MRCLSYRLVKIHKQFTNAHLLRDKASLRLIMGHQNLSANLKDFSFSVLVSIVHGGLSV